ncbi:MAG TPA: hypothetical protein VFU46_05915 [Gemmatimonadales bacterium]|nr:hypothetical protein [Gemmatimonadales bacterium]
MRYTASGRRTVSSSEAAQHPVEPLHHRIEIENRGLQHLLAAVREKLTGEPRRPLGRLADPPGVLARVGRRRDRVTEQVAVAEDAGEQVVEVVRDAAREPADRLHFLGVPELGLEVVDLLACAAALEAVADRAHQGSRVDVRLQETVLGPVVHRAQRLLVVDMPAQHEHGQVRHRTTHGVQRREAFAVGQEEVEQHGVELLSREHPQRRVEPLHPDHVKQAPRLPAQHLLHQQRIDGVVLDQQNPRARILCGLDLRTHGERHPTSAVRYRSRDRVT